MLPLSAQALSPDLDPHNVPLFLTTGVSPNFVITLDDSGSMERAYVPDGISGYSAQRRFKSATYNAQYYNPNINYLPPLNASGVALTTSFDAAWRNGFYTTHGSIDLNSEYRPQREFHSTGTTAGGYDQLFAYHDAADSGASPKPFSSTSVNTRAYYYNFVTSPLPSGCDGTIYDDDCYQLVFVTSTSGPGATDERQNFANWYSFYRTRNLATVTAASRAFQDITPEMRVAWQGLTTCTSFGTTTCKGWDGVSVENRIRRYDTAHKARLYQWLFKLPASGMTPLRLALDRAGEYFTIQTGLTSPYAFDPQLDDDAAKRYSCRANFSMLMTDGVWNSSDATGTIKSDSVATALPGVFDTSCVPTDPGYPNCMVSPGYTPVSPFKDTNAHSLADVAFHYWATDLNPSLKNDVARYPSTLDNTDPATLLASYWDPKNNPAKWQHMVTYTVGLGLTRVLDTTTPKLKWDGDPHSTNTTTSSYPALKAGTLNWPAAGDNLVGNVADLWHAALNSRGKFFSADDPETLNKSMKSIVNDVASKVGSASSIAANSKRIGTDTRIYLASFDSNDWSGELEALPLDPLTGVPGAPEWSASANLPAPAARNIWTTSGGGVTSFTGSFGGTLTADVVDYLRGVQTNELPSGTFRSRTKILGDIVSSDPVFVGGENFRLEVIPAYAASTSASYPAFVSSKSTTSMIYVGANDGMLHGFDAVTGVEKFAYVPSELHGSLADLTNVTYPANHKFFVDGASGFGDAYFGSAWHTVLVGTLGAGGKSVFALDVTDPNAMDGTKVLWEFNGDTHAGKMGNIFGPAAVAPFADGHFYAVFSNGYNSTDNQAGLFLVRVDNPSIYYYIDTQYGSATAKNGLSTPKLVDLNNDRIIDAIYAGDMQGNVWKFDVTSTLASSWKIAHGTVAAPEPMFVAKDGTGGTAVRQPIQAQLGVSGPPNGVAGDAMVFFGTGRYFVNGDATATDKQSFYGVLDDGGSTSYGRSDLWTQSIIYQGLVGTQEVRVTSTTAKDWTSKKGWVIDLVPPSGTLKGERVISPPLLRFGRVIFNTMEPSVGDPCLQGSSWLMELDAESGGNLDYAALDINGDGEFDLDDFIAYSLSGTAYNMAPAGVKSGTMTLNQPTVVTAGSKEYKFSSNVGKGIGVITEKSGSSAGRTSWRQIQ
jgi:type IV pilus assembly protein PilY1